MMQRLTSALTLLLLSGLAVAGPAMDASGAKQATNWHAIIMFLIFVAMTMGITRSEERRVGKECRSRWSPYH